MTQVPKYEVLFYEKSDGTSLADEFLDDLPFKARAKLEKWFEQLEIHGPHLPRSFADVVQGKIRELRLRFGLFHYRFLYFFFGKKIIVTHGFVKKTDQVPAEEIARAIRYMDDFLIRVKRGEIEL